MTWFDAIPTTLAGILIILLPGGAVAALIGLRGLWLWATAPVISATLYATASLALPRIGLRWELLPVAGFVLVFAALIVMLFRVVPLLKFSHQDSPRFPPTWNVLAWSFSAGVLGAYAIIGIGAVTNISQTFDNVFHLNAIAFIGDSGDASAFGISRITAPDGGGNTFYPVLWHALVQLTQQTTGASIPVSVNAFNLAAVVCIWPTGMLLLTRQLIRASRISTLVTAVLIASFPAFPLYMLSYGVLYTYFLGLAFVPAIVAVVLQVVGVTQDRAVGRKPGLVVLLVGLLPGIALCHPSALMTVLALSVPPVFVAGIAGWRSVSARAQRWRIVGLLAFTLAGTIFLVVLRPPHMWEPLYSKQNALWQVFGLALANYGVPALSALLLMAGAVLLLRHLPKTGIAAVGMWFMFASVYFVTASVNNPLLRSFGGPWYGDIPRFAAIMPIVAIPLIAYASTIWIKAVTRHTGTLRKPLSLALIGILAVSTQFGAGYQQFLTDMRIGYATTSDALLLSDDEVALLERLDDQVPASDMVIGNPWTGTPLAYAYAHRQVLATHILMAALGDRAILFDRLSSAGADPSVCAAVHALNAHWYLDFGDQEVHNGHHPYPGFDEVETSGVLELIDREGEAKLYRVAACD